MKKISILASVLTVGILNITTAYSSMSHEHMNHGDMHKMVHKNPTYLKVDSFKRELFLPPVLEGTIENNKTNFDIQVNQGEWSFIEGYTTKTLGYNGPVLGPILKLRKGKENKISITNNLQEETTLHWHGAIVSESVDGVHNSEIQPKKTKTIDFTLNQPSATLWFHPHTMHKTAKQVYNGLAGLIYLEDEMSDTLKIPKTYGVDDFPLVIQEKKFDEKGNLEYLPSKMDKVHGNTGGYMMINGIVSPYLNVASGVVRFRVVNGSNATNYKIELGGNDFYQIASDGGFLENSIQMKEIILSPGERAELLIDTKKLKETSYLTVNENKALEIRKNITKNYEINKIPKNLVTIEDVIIPKNLNTREFNLKTSKMKNTINNTLFDMSKTNFQVQKGTKEIWTIRNSEGHMDMPHPFHVHGAQFRVIERNGNNPPLNERGWKDTVNLNPGEEVKILIEFKTNGLTVYHCHILEHEESGMMGQFKIS